MEKRAADAEREILQWKKVRFMADKVGDVFEGYITGVAPFGMFVELTDHYVEGLVHVSTMADDYYRFREQQHALFGENTKKTYRLGDPVKVQIIRVDMERRQIDLGLEDVLEKVRRDERSRGASRSSASAKASADRSARPKKESAFAKASTFAKATVDRSARQAGKGKRKQRPGKNERKARRR
jgi:ribonuclease R